MAEIKKLIEVALPLERINAESAREKSIRHGHPSTLHLWWARRPLAAARAVIWSSLVDDPSSHPEQFPTEEAQNAERQRLFKILEDLVVWENSNNEEVLAAAKAEILKSTGGNPPALLDPFAGGGAIPLEAQRLGLKAYASDLNPVAVMINKAMIEIPPKFAGQAPVNPDARRQVDGESEWKGAQGLAEDVRYYGEWMKHEAFKRIGHLYPKVKAPKEQGGGEATVIAWIWARTVKCPNPACGCEMPLASSFVLSKKKGNEAWVEPVNENGTIHFTVHQGKCPKDKESYKMGRSAVFKCPICGEVTKDEYVKSKGQAHEIGAQLMAIVAEGPHGRIYLSPSAEHELAAQVTKPENFPDGSMPQNPRWFSPPAFGMTDYSDLFTNRQLTALTTFSGLVAEAQAKAEADAVKAGLANDHIPLADGGIGALAYGQAVGVYLAFSVDRCADYYSSIATWGGEFVAHTFGRQAIPMVWDYAECNPFSSSTGNWTGAINWIVHVMNRLPSSILYSSSMQFDAQSDNGLRDIMISTDPPYYDNIGYADLSDFFYVWMRRSLKDTYTSLFRTMLVPKAEELIATPYRHEGSVEKAKEFFEDGMLKTCRQIYKYARNDVPVTIYYAYKQSDTEEDEAQASLQTASTGWETMLSAIIQAGFAITGTWPMRTERQGRMIGNGTNALASSIVLVCRKRPEDAPVCTRRSFIGELRRELRPALKKLQASNIAPVDLAQSAIGPGMGIYSHYSKVLEADGTPMTVRSALQIINQELDVYFNEQDGELDRDSRFCVDLYMQNAFNDMKFGDADTLARAKNTSVAALASKGVLYAQKGVVRLCERSDLPERVDSGEQIVWLLCQQLTRAMEQGGVSACAEIVKDIFGSNGEHAKALAYRLYTIAERKSWASEAYAYNALVISWPEIQSKAAELQAAKPEQLSIF
jgi:putative DNA methylase